MTTETDEPASILTYELSCTDCAYRATVDGSVHEVLDVADTHREERGESYTDHFVDVELCDRTE